MNTRRRIDHLIYRLQVYRHYDDPTFRVYSDLEIALMVDEAVSDCICGIHDDGDNTSFRIARKELVDDHFHDLEQEALEQEQADKVSARDCFGVRQDAGRTL